MVPRVALPLKYQLLASLLTVTPLASVKPELTNKAPVTLRLEPIVIATRLPLLLISAGVGSVLVIVPFWIEPESVSPRRKLNVPPLSDSV